VDLIPVTASSADHLLAAFHELAVVAASEWLPEIDPPGPVETRSELADDRYARRGGFLAMDGARAVGAAAWLAPRHEDRDVVWGWVGVDSSSRRRGIGRALVDAVAASAREDGRRRWLSDAREGSAADAFVTALGATTGQHSVASVVHLPSLDRADVARLAAGVTPGYRLVQWVGPCPEDLVEEFASARGAMNDSPTGELGLEDWHWTAERVQGWDERRITWDVRAYTTAAVHVASGAVAGFTDLLVVDRPTTALQEDTAVVAAHRGNGLGLAMKAANLIAMGQREPAITDVVTWNAEDNRYMRAVNERLGFRPLGRWREVVFGF
jgi:mycothiol synthase